MIVVFSIASSQDRSISMTSIPQLSRTLRKLLFVEANQLAAQAGVIQRQRVFSGASLLQLLVFGWLKHPQAGPSQLARFAGSLGLKLSQQTDEGRAFHQADRRLALGGAATRSAVAGV